MTYVLYGYFDGDFIVSTTCPKCGKSLGNDYMTSFEEGKEMEFQCGHKFRMDKLVQELHISDLSNKEETDK